MPNSMVKSFAEKTGKSVADVEAKWNEAKSKVKVPESDPKFYPELVSILKNMLGINEEVVAATTSSNIAIKPGGGGVTKRTGPDGQHMGMDYFEVDYNDFSGISNARKMRQRYAIQDERVREYLQKTNYQKMFLVKHKGLFTKVGRGY